MQYIPYDNNWYVDVSLVVKAKVRNGEKQQNTSEGSEYKKNMEINGFLFRVFTYLNRFVNNNTLHRLHDK